MNGMKNSISKWVAVGILAAAPALMQASTGSAALSPLENKVRHELVMLPYLNVCDNVSYRVEGGTVTLFGQVTDPVLKSDAGNVVKRIEGVARVNNQIEVLPLSSFDNRIRWQTYRAIYGFPSLQRYGLGVVPSIHIIVKNGNVTLEGVVGSAMDRAKAEQAARLAATYFSFTNNLRVDAK
jgi:hyperosmotically inducible protein